MLLRFGADEPRLRRSKLRAFEIVLLLHVCTSTWWWAGGGWWMPAGDWSWLDASLLATLLFSTALTALGLHPRFRDIALPGIAVLHGTVVVNTFPETANHTYLEFFFLVLLAFFRQRDESEDQLLLGALRWMAVVVFFFSGLQKLAHGYYADGIFLAFQLQQPGFATGLLFVDLFASPPPLIFALTIPTGGILDYTVGLKANAGVFAQTLEFEDLTSAAFSNLLK